MGNVLRVLGIIAVSMLMSLTALLLVLFTICGGFQDRNVNGPIVLAVCIGIFVGGVALIVWMGRNIQSSRRLAAAAATGGLAVPPAGPVAAYHPGPSACAPARADGSAAPLAGSALQQLNVLRGCLALLAFIPIALMAWSFPTYHASTMGLAVYMAVQAVLNAVPPAVLAFVLMRNPPPGLGLDATAGMAAASIVFRILFFGYLVLTVPQFGGTASYIGRLGFFTVFEAAIVVLALLVRRSIGPINAGALVLAGFGFLAWEAGLQTLMTVLIRLVY
jgi:hypothetical protein